MIRRFITFYTAALVLVAAVSCGGSSATQRPTVGTPGAAEVRTSPSPGGPRDTSGYIPPWNFMSHSTSGIDTFLLRHPSYDGRSVVILVFDTGVDPSIPGLLETSTGQPKVIDVVDVSGSNVVSFAPAEIRIVGGDTIATAPGQPVRLRGLSAVLGARGGDSGKSGDLARSSGLYIGHIDERGYRNASVRDFDGDGESSSRFGVLLYESSDGWRVIVDTDADSSLVGETSVRDFSAAQEAFTFRQRDEGRAPLSVAAKIAADEHRVSFVYDMQGHGTHVAGIAAGYGVNGEPGFNGIAPGAQVIGVKFSSDAYSDNTVTGTMRRAYEYAARLADSLAEHSTPVVVNMSFGIGSSIEGRAEIEEYLSALLPKHPNLYVVTSAGNEGPGLSTIGIPAAESSLITVGALLPTGIGGDSYGAVLQRDIIWDFSSRGGEVNKPDVVAPGSAVSTIVRFAFDPKASGTSMASPYVAGVVAVLLSAMQQEYPGWMPTQELMRRVLRYSARELPHYAAVEQGGGVVNVESAYRLLKRLRHSGLADDVQTYTISTYSPNYPDRRGPTAFWRSGYVPGDDWRQTFMVNRRGIDFDAEFFRAYTLEATADWLVPVQKTVYLRNTSGTSIDVIYDREKLRSPGLYSARILARRASGTAAADRGAVEFELLNTVIVPHRFSPEASYVVSTREHVMEAGHSDRHYFAPPAGAAALEFTLRVPEGSRSNVSGTVVDHEGYVAGYLPGVNASERDRASSTLSMRDLGTGVIEVVVEADAVHGAGRSSRYQLEVRALMLQVDAVVTTVDTLRHLHVTARSTGDRMLNGRFSYGLKGYGRLLHDTLAGDRLRIPVTIHPEDGALWITPRFSKEHYLLATDILARLVDEDGIVQAEDAFNQPSVQLFLPNFERDRATYFLEIEFGAAAADASGLHIPIEILEEHVRPNDPRSLGGFSGTELVPYVPTTLHGVLPALTIPAGYYGIGELFFQPERSEARIPFEFRIDR